MTARPRRTSGRGKLERVVALGGGTLHGSDFSAIRSSESPPCRSVESKPIQQGQNRILDHWELWFPAKLGPPRWRIRRKVRVKDRTLELPPTQNDRLHHHAKAAWVREWKTEAWAIARRRQLPRLERARVSAIVYRERLGTADALNDFERLKHLIDGLVEAGALAGDTYKHVTPGTIEERRGSPGVILIVDELE